MKCLHRREADECMICQAIHRLQTDPLSEERQQLVRYFRFISKLSPQESVLGPVHRETMGYAAHWIENRVDEKWAREAAEQVEKDTRALHLLIRNGKGDEQEADDLREKIVDGLECVSSSEKKRLNDLSGDLAAEYDP